MGRFITIGIGLIMASHLITATPTGTPMAGKPCGPAVTPLNSIMVGIGAPSMLAGGLVGGVMGGLAAPLHPHPNEAYWVGMVSTGLWVGGGVGLGIATGAITHQLGTVMDPMVAGALVATVIVGYVAHVIGTAFDATHTIRQHTQSDAIQHRWVMGQVSQQADPISALMMASLKESSDFWLGTGHPEWRDWHHNWVGITQGPTP